MDSLRDPEKYKGKKNFEMPPIFDREVSFLETFKQRRSPGDTVISSR
jgi:hypothetical protein